MARTIGTKNKNYIKRLVAEAKLGGVVGVVRITDYVTDKLPLEVFETWAGASSEIQRLVQDELN